MRNKSVFILFYKAVANRLKLLMLWYRDILFRLEGYEIRANNGIDMEDLLVFINNNHLFDIALDKTGFYEYFEKRRSALIESAKAYNLFLGKKSEIIPKLISESL